MTSNRFVAHVAALFCFPFIALLAGMLHRWLSLDVMGIVDRGRNAGFVMIAFPMYSIPLFAFWLVGWELLRSILKRRLGLFLTLTLVVAISLLFGFMVTGTNGFQLSGNQRAYNYFFTGILLVGAIIHFVLIQKSERSGVKGN